jgi:hypothetical protein
VTVWERDDVVVVDDVYYAISCTTTLDTLSANRSLCRTAAESFRLR